MKNVGLKTEADSERLYASLLEAKDLLATSRNEGRKFIHLLRVLTGIVEDNITIEDDFTERSRTILPSFTDAQWHKMLTNNNAELKALSSKIKQSQSLYESSKTEHYGTVISVGSVGNDTLHSREYTLWQELYESILDTNRLDNTIEAKKMAARALGKTVTITEGRYKEGLSTYIEVLEAQRAYDNARISQNAAMLQKIASMAHIQRLIPQGVTHDIHD